MWIHRLSRKHCSPGSAAAVSPKPLTTPCTFAIWSAHVNMPASAIHLRSCISVCIRVEGGVGWGGGLGSRGRRAEKSPQLLAAPLHDAPIGLQQASHGFRLGQRPTTASAGGCLTLPAARRCAGLRNVRVRLPSVSEICKRLDMHA